MRIGVIGPSWPDCFAKNILDALSTMQHETTYLGSSYALGSTYATRVVSTVRNLFPPLDERAQLPVARAAVDHECEIVINTEQRIMPGVVRKLKAGGAKVALWFPDPMTNLGRQLALLAPYDALFFKEPHLVARLRALLDLPVWYLPEACNPRWHRPLATPGTEQHLVIAGNMYPSRIRLLERLMAKGIPLKLYGAGFPRWVGHTPLRAVHAGRTVYEEDKARAFGSAAAVLNTFNLGEINGVNARLFEAAGSGASVLTEFRPTLPEIFDIGDEVLAFHDFDDLVGQATRLLSEGGLSVKLGAAAAQRAHKDHTYEKRLTVILEKLS